VQFCMLLTAQSSTIHSSSYRIENIEKRVTESSRREMLRLAEERIDRQVAVKFIVVQGVPFAEIINTARKCKADLIVIGTHGRTGISKILIGSVAEKVVRKAPYPVLTVKRPGYKFERLNSRIALSRKEAI